MTREPLLRGRQQKGKQRPSAEKAALGKRWREEEKDSTGHSSNRRTRSAGVSQSSFHQDKIEEGEMEVHHKILVVVEKRSTRKERDVKNHISS